MYKCGQKEIEPNYSLPPNRTVSQITGSAAKLGVCRPLIMWHMACVEACVCVEVCVCILQLGDERERDTG